MNNSSYDHNKVENEGIMIDASRLVHLDIVYDYEKLGKRSMVDLLENQSQKMVHLNHLTLIIDSPPHFPKLGTLFTKTDGFKNLKSLRVSFIHEDWKDSSIWGRLENFDLSISRIDPRAQKQNERLFKEIGFSHNLKKVRRLEISHFYFTGEKMIADLPKLEYINVYSCRNLSFKVDKNRLKKVVFDRVEEEIILDMIHHNHNLEEIEIKSGTLKKLGEIFNNRSNNFSGLKNLSLRFINLEDFESSLKVQSFGANVESVLVWSVVLSDECLTKPNYDNLTHLQLHYLRGITNFKDMKWKFSERLISLKINTRSDRYSYFEKDTVVGNEDDIFRNNQFSSLEELWLREHYERPAFTGKDWSQFPSLRKFFLECKGINDSFFEYQKLPNLEELELYGCDEITGNWTEEIRFPKLKVLKLFGGDKLTDLMFQKFRYPNLQKLKISSSDKITGTGWCVFENLRSLKIRSCSNFSKECFERICKNPEDVMFSIRSGW